MGNQTLFNNIKSNNNENIISIDDIIKDVFDEGGIMSRFKSDYVKDHPR